MIQFNLLPDIKIEYIKTRYRKRMIIMISAIASAVCFAIFVLLFLYVRVNQPKYMRDLEADINTNLKKVQSTQDLDKILTIQNQLNSLPALHDQKVVSSRLMDYLIKVTPAQATISDVTIDFEPSTNTMSVKGNADSIATVNKFTDTLKFTEFKVNNEAGQSGKAFSEVVLQGYSLGAGATGSDAVSYDITFKFDPVIFQQVKDLSSGASEAVTLTVPHIVSTRSETEKPASLFAPQPNQPVRAN